MIVLDASAIVAILASEDDGVAIAGRLDAARRTAEPLFASTVTLWEAALAVARLRSVTRLLAGAEVETFLRLAEVALVAPDTAITSLATEAAERYGMGPGYPGILNLGDCFSYATAKHFGAALLFKGDVFGRTDIVAA